MSMFTKAINEFRSTVSNPKFYASARAGMGKAVAAAQAYAPKLGSLAKNPMYQVGGLSVLGGAAGVYAAPRGHKTEGLGLGVAAGAGAYLGYNNPKVRGAVMGAGSRASRAMSRGIGRASNFIGL